MPAIGYGRQDAFWLAERVRAFEAAYHQWASIP